MGKSFRDYDEEFKHNLGKTFENICKSHGRPADSDWCFKKSWAEVYPDWQHIDYTQGIVQEAVYHAADANDWQFFRVGLKGLTTDCKLWCLAWYYSQQPTVLRHVRVTNYLGALVRGGILNDKWEVLK